MNDLIRIKTALISVYSKEGIEDLAHTLESYGIEIISTGGTFDYLSARGIHAVSIESLTSYPAILGGRVKTLHPKIFGAILWRRDSLSDVNDIEKYEIPSVDLVVVDLYPFEQTVASSDDEKEIIEKIDIGGISLIRAAAKNHEHVMVISSQADYSELTEILARQNGCTKLGDRLLFAARAFSVTSGYDTAIFNYFNRNGSVGAFRKSLQPSRSLRYGENPHQNAEFYGKLDDVFSQLHGKELSFNNLVDIDAAIALAAEFAEPAVAVIKHTNPCGIAVRESIREAYVDALACDPVSAFGGVIIANGIINVETAAEIDKIFFEILIADGFENDALDRLRSKKNRILLQKNPVAFPNRHFKAVLNGVLEQDKDLASEKPSDFQCVTVKKPTQQETEALIFANRVVKHLKSNAIVLAKNNRMIGCGMGQTSRVDAMRQAIAKAAAFGFDTAGSVMASDAFFPFADSVGIAHGAGVTAIIQPGGSIRDQDSVKFCDEHGLSMVFTGIRHFKH